MQLTSDSAGMLRAALRALGGNPTHGELATMAAALERGPADLADELSLAGQTGADAEAARERLMSIAPPASAFVLLDLMVAAGAGVQALARRSEFD